MAKELKTLSVYPVSAQHQVYWKEYSQLPYFRWIANDEFEPIKKIVENAIRISYNFKNSEIKKWRKNFENLKSDIENTFYNLEKTYDTENIDDKLYIAKTLNVKIDEYGNNGDTIT